MTLKTKSINFQADDFKITLDVTYHLDTIWFTLEQLTKVFSLSKSKIKEYINTINEEEEILADNKPLVIDNQELYSLELTLAIAYQVKSKDAIIFRKWAYKVLKEYIIKGYLIDQNRLLKNDSNYQLFNNTVRLITDSVNRKDLTLDESKGLLDVISKYAYALDTLDKYDHQSLTITNITKDDHHVMLRYEDAMKEIRKMSDYGKSEWFGKEKDDSFKGAISAIYQSAFGVDCYPSVEEKAANLLYFIVKDHAFYDGNKRIAAAIFLWFLDIYGILYKNNGKRVIEDNALVAIVLMIALSNPNEKDTIVKIVVNLINHNN